MDSIIRRKGRKRFHRATIKRRGREAKSSITSSGWLMIIARGTRLERSESATGFEQVEHGGRQDLYTVYRPTSKITRDLSSGGGERTN